jgi:hypothetical protein
MPSNTPEKAREYYLNYYKEKLQERNKTKNYCFYCNALITPWNWSKHTQTKKHVQKVAYKDAERKESDNDRASDYEKYNMIRIS